MRRCCLRSFIGIESLPKRASHVSYSTDSPARDLSHKFVEKGSIFNDHVFVKADAGKGGDGCVSFLREKYLPKGPPNGGSGGPGGDVYIMAVAGENSLSTPPRIKSAHGQNGRGSSMNGRKGDDVVIKVPVGTIVRELDMPERMLPQSDETDRGPWVHYPRYEEDNLESDRLKIAEKILRKQQRSMMPSIAQVKREAVKITLDLDKPTPANEPILLCRGGTGGLGNTFFLTADNRAPRFASRGLPGQEKYFELELKTLADVGLVGLPNAGKSTFLGAISNARPRVANWAFTTLSPFLGTISSPDGGQFTVADIPGIIEGAARNRGLGHGFLRHIERAEILAFVIDLSGTPADDYRTLRSELRAYKPGLEDRQSVIIANKADLEETEEGLKDLHNAVDTIFAEHGTLGQSKPIIVPLSSKDQLGIKHAIEIMRTLVRDQRRKKQVSDASRRAEEDEIKVIMG